MKEGEIIMKLSKFANVLKSEQSYIIHQTLYNSIMSVDSDEYKKIIDNLLINKTINDYTDDNEFYKALVDQNILVEEDRNELAEFNYLYEEAEASTMGIMLIVTRQCNFRCPYCYEEHDNSYIMNWNIYQQTINFIKEYVAMNKIDKIEIQFFGGEPLMEYENMLRFMDELKNTIDENIYIGGNVTTNGYYLTKDRMEELCKRNITSFQITIDGLKETHDQTRYLVNKKGTWDTIINNLKEIKTLDCHFNIVLRTNYTPVLLQTFPQYFKFIKENFGDDGRYSVYFEAVKDLGNLDENLKITDNEKNETSYIMDLAGGFKLNLESFSTHLAPFSMRCYAGKKHYYIIDYDGTIRKCSVDLDSSYNNLGNVSEGYENMDYKMNASWTRYMPADKCLNCTIFPICCAKKCPLGVKEDSYCDKLMGIYEAALRNQYFSENQ